MKRSSYAKVLLGSLILGGLLFTGCKKDEEEPATVPVPTGAEPATTTEAPPAADPSASADAPQASADAPATPTAPAAPATQTVRKGESIDACCSALRAVQKSGKTATAKSKAAAAAAVCPGIAKLVKDGTTSRASGLAQIRSALAGFDVPGECR
ncbi:MAG: hypothetical protein R3B70_15875 [Polyangiaceae bacterium]